MSIRTLALPPFSFLSSFGSAGAGARQWAPGDDASLWSLTDAAVAYFDLLPITRKGIELWQVRMACNPGAARSSTARMSIALRSRTFTSGGSPTTSTLIAKSYDDTTSSQQVVALGAGAYPGEGGFANGYQGALWLEVQAGNDGGSHASDELIGVEIDFRARAAW